VLTAGAILVSRMAIVAAIVVSVSVVATRSGPMIGAMLAALPISAGPAYIFLALDHGGEFVARSTVASLIAVSGTAPFVVSYDRVRRVAGTLPSFLAAISSFIGTIALLNLFTWTLWRAAFVATILMLAAILLTRETRRQAQPFSAPMRGIDLVVRAAAVMAVVATVTILAEVAGPRAAGYGALMPVVFMSFILVMQPRVGGAAIAGLFAFGLFGILGFVPAFVALNLAAVPLGIWWALALALAISLVWNGAIVGLRRRGWLRV
jgi:hypothetical protein